MEDLALYGKGAGHGIEHGSGVLPDMIFLVYTPLSSGNIEHNLGLADYSYYFVMKRFLPLLQEFGEVRVLEQAPTDDDVSGHQRSGQCVYLSFTPPDKVAAITRCPVVPVFAWEYSTIPDEEFSRAQDNWVRALQVTGNAITHSRYALDVVRAQLGQDYAVRSIPAPIWDSCQAVREARRQSRPRGLEGLRLDCTVIDSDDYLISNTSIRPRQGAGGGRGRLLGGLWDGAPLTYDMSAETGGLTLIGFNNPEPWGVWSRSGYPWLLFDCAIEGEFELSVTLRGYVRNIGKRLRLEMGSATADLLLSEGLRTHVFRLNIEHPTNVLAFIGLSERETGAADPRDIGIGLSAVHIRRPLTESLPTDSVTVEMSSPELVTDGFHVNEPPGRWTSASSCSVQLPTLVSGDFRLTIDLFHILHNNNRVVEVCLGEQRGEVTIQDGWSRYELEFLGVAPTDYIAMSGLQTGPGGETDPRSLGIGIASISLQRIPQPDSRRGISARWQSLAIWPAVGGFIDRQRTPRGILYTAIFNPKDGRKNWEDIITAFVYAFRDDASATLLIKITYHELSELYEDIFTFQIELHPFKCRLIFIHGFLGDEAYDQLLQHSHFIVNASRGEGQCLPLMEFMSAGVPAVAPDNTAMGEYISRSNAFVVESSPEPTFWPQDPRQVFRTLWQRVNWESLVSAFSDSAKVYRKQQRSYRKMSEAAAESQNAYCSMAVARREFRAMLDGLENDHGR